MSTYCVPPLGLHLTTPHGGRRPLPPASEMCGPRAGQWLLRLSRGGCLGGVALGRSDRLGVEITALRGREAAVSYRIGLTGRLSTALTLGHACSYFNRASSCFQVTDAKDIHLS